MISKHTKGPWRVFDEKPWIVLMGQPSKLGNGEQYAACGGDLERNEANARLIAAAPEMLAMLKELEWSGNQPYTDERCCPVCEQPDFCEGKAFAHAPNCKLAELIAKAEGE